MSAIFYWTLVVPGRWFLSLQPLITVQLDCTTVFNHAKYQYFCQDLVTPEKERL